MDKINELIESLSTYCYIENNLDSLEKLSKKVSKIQSKLKTERRKYNKLLITQCGIVKNSKLEHFEKIAFSPKESETHFLEAEKCHICKQGYKEIHYFYHTLCPKCADFNFAKRSQTRDLTGKIAIVTGGRIKIGYETCLKLLRSNCIVIATTRYPHDASQRYSKEKDYHIWSKNLTIFPLKLHCLDYINNLGSENESLVTSSITSSITTFINFIKANYDHIDILINNAAQTVNSSSSKINTNKLVPTWTQRLTDVSENELLDVTLINYIGPFILLKHLKSLLMNANEAVVINVSAVEGKYTSSIYSKTDRHVHTNGAKAALNMITRSVAFSWKQDGIYVNSVDTGWITNEFEDDSNTVKKDTFCPPLDEIDGASRILDLIYNPNPECYGMFWKDYSRTGW